MLKMEMCARCGKMFIPNDEHLHELLRNDKTCYYCSYICWKKDGGDNGRRAI